MAMAKRITIERKAKWGKRRGGGAYLYKKKEEEEEKVCGTKCAMLLVCVFFTI